MDKYAIVIVGPSGAGKTTVAESLISVTGALEMSRSATTRAKRGDGKDDEYIYITKPEFLEAMAAGDILESTDYNGNFYGTRKIELERIWNMDKNPILVLDYYGAESLKKKLDVPVFAIYVYTSLEETKRRLEARDKISGSTERSRAAIASRLRENVADYKKLHTIADLFDFYVMNDVVSPCTDRAISALSLLKEGREAMSGAEKHKLTEEFLADALSFEKKYGELLTE